MSFSDDGPALVLIYGDGRIESALLHAQDGGAAYMGPLLRKAVQYAKTHYDSGNILDVLMSEGEMKEVDASTAAEAARASNVRHVYYVTYRWHKDSSRKTYRVRADHLKNPRYVTPSAVPMEEPGIPDTAKPLA